MQDSQRNPWATDMQTSEIESRLLQDYLQMQLSPTPQKDIFHALGVSFITPRCPSEICAQRQCLHFFTILLTAICDRGWCLRLNASQNRDWCKKSRKSKNTSVVCGKCLKPFSEKHSQNLTGIFWTSARFPWWHPDEWTHVPEVVMKHPGNIGIWAVESSALVASEFSPRPGAFNGSSGSYSYTYDST